MSELGYVSEFGRPAEALAVGDRIVFADNLSPVARMSRTKRVRAQIAHWFKHSSRRFEVRREDDGVAVRRVA